ncbi:hypothetical protein AMAG_11902 [Allomyces macrogynus ATCC 38327]|uniref:Uncharacterized protein n=1 Tax=Allomyces macrogynus (strain ATCC 38327) TaxID=578462 RepID=A0A0L0SY53_ALLM3|nr:hypothetical protein AMAG_11902 [Allomyces macrogynus ATCC 38327]|eukprot:KNE67441.1 hypothetical protein AMAG_11902 [Allomyces macrogynus ATCC 38327]
MRRKNLPPGMTRSYRVLFWLKMVLSVVNLAAAIILLAQVDPSETVSSTYFGWITTTLVLAIAVPTHFFEHYRSRRPSTSLCTFYLVLILVLVVRLRTLLLSDMPDLAHILSRPLIVTALVFLAESFSGKAVDLRTDPALAHAAVPNATGVPTHESPEMSTSYLSRLGLWWVHSLLREGRAKTLVLADCWSLPWRLRSHPTGDLLQAAWDHQVETRGAKPSFIRAFLAVFAPKLAVVSGMAIVVALTEFVNPLFVQYLIKLVLARGTKDERSVAEGVVVAAAYVIVSVLAAFLAGQKQHLSNLEQLRVQSAVQCVVYHKALQLPSHRSIDAGAVLAHAQVDAAGVASIMTSLIGWLPSPFTLAIALYMLYLQIGWSMVMAVAVITLSSPVVGSLGDKLMALRMEIMKQLSARTKLMTETVGGMNTLRLYEWTGYLRDRILAIRDKELQLTITSMRFNAASVSMSDIVPSLAMFLTFAVYTLTQPANALTSERVFVALALFNIVDQHTKIMLWAWTPLVDAKAAMDRVTEFLQSPERVVYVEHDAEDHEHPVAIEIDAAQFAFTEDKPVLSIDQLAIARGSVTAVVGKIGSGKSALLTAILGEMDKLKGAVTVRGSVAYFAQQPWIQHVSIRDNILFGRALDQARYDAVVQACALTSDFAALPKGDLTFVGEKGTNLSGGQRARVACARALYADSDIVLLDDPLSAVDAHVDRHLFDAWFDKEKGLLRGKTVVLVTHAMHHLDQADRVLALSEGKIIEQGTYDEVIALNGVVTELVGEVIASRKDKASDKVAEAAADGSADSKDAESGAASSPPSDDSDEDENKEIKNSGKVAWATYKACLSYVGGWLSVVVLLSFVVTSGFQFSSTIFLGLWGSASSSGDGDDVGYWLGGYGGLLIAGAIAAVSSFYIVLAVVATRVARITMTKLLNAILRAPMSWWDVTPAAIVVTSRILNRMTGDQRTVDRMIPIFSFQILAFVFQVLGTVITIVTATPWFLVVLIPITGIFLLVQRVYLASSRELERVTMAQASPVYQHITESLTGLTTIRAFAHSARFQTDAEAKVDLAASGTYTLNATRWWLSVQLQLLSTAMIGVFGILAVSTPVSGTAILGTALTYAMQITGILAATIETSAMLENSLVSMERIQEYMDVPAEAREDTPFALDATWPASGAVEFRDYSTTYRAGLDPVLKHINLQINPGERVGICGRTGSGKSSLMLALFRVLEATSCSIIIDGIDIATVGLQDLRSRLTILPQEAVLFDAPLRANLDPAGTIDDAVLWSALERASLVEYVRSLEGQLDAPLTRESMSAGQAQLLCLARAIVRKSKVLVLDEATAAMDPVTDAVVQETVRREFEGCTVLTVAHRI